MEDQEPMGSDRKGASTDVPEEPTPVDTDQLEMSHKFAELYNIGDYDWLVGYFSQLHVPQADTAGPTVVEDV